VAFLFRATMEAEPCEREQTWISCFIRSRRKMSLHAQHVENR
jgi:hypothetical protein